MPDDDNHLFKINKLETICTLPSTHYIPNTHTKRKVQQKLLRQKKKLLHYNLTLTSIIS